MSDLFKVYILSENCTPDEKLKQNAALEIRASDLPEKIYSQFKDVLLQRLENKITRQMLDARQYNHIKIFPSFESALNQEENVISDSDFRQSIKSLTSINDNVCIYYYNTNAAA